MEWTLLLRTCAREALRFSTVPTIVSTASASWSCGTATGSSWRSARILGGAPPNMRMKLSWRGGRSEGESSFLMAAAAPRRLCADRLAADYDTADRPAREVCLGIARWGCERRGRGPHLLHPAPFSDSGHGRGDWC